MRSGCFHNSFIMLRLCLYYAFIMPTLRFYYIISNNINIYIALSLESSRCGALWNHHDVVLFWNRLYRDSLWNCHDVMHLESSRCVSLRNRRDVALFLESSL